MNRVMRDVLPTEADHNILMTPQVNEIDHGLPLCSPRKTSLNFLKGLLNSAAADIITEQFFLFKFSVVGVFCRFYPVA